MLTGLLGSTPSCLGAICLAYVPDPAVVPPEPEPEEPAVGGWTRRRQPPRMPAEKLRKEEDDIIPLILTLLS